MERKKIIGIVAVVVSLTFALIALGVRGGIFQSSLLNDEGTNSGRLLIDFAQNETQKEFSSDEERNLIYALLINGNNQQQGVYFPRVYKAYNNTTGLVAVAFKHKEFTSIEKKLTLKIKFPTQGMKFVGKSIVSTENYTAEASPNYDDGILTVHINLSSATPMLLAKSIDPLLLLPFQLTVAKPEDTSELRMKILSAMHTTFGGAEVALPFIEAEGEIHVSPNTNGNTNVSLPTPNNKKTTGELPPIKKTVYTAPGTSGTSLKNTPEITKDKTLVLPNTTISGAEEPIFIYVSVSDKDGAKDIEKVLIDLSPLGLAKENRLLEIEKNTNFTVYATNFILPNGVAASDTPYKLPLVVSDKEGHKVTGTFSLTVTPGKKKIELDLNADSKIDIQDLTLFINAYQEATS